MRRSVLMKAEEIAALRAQTLSERGETIAGAEAGSREGGKVVAFGNGGPAPDAMDLVADLAILAAQANDAGPEVVFQRQIVAHGAPDGLAVALSTSGGSANAVEARRRGLVRVALVGDGGGRIDAERLAGHVVVTRSEHVPRIQEAQASAYRVLRVLVER